MSQDAVTTAGPDVAAGTHPDLFARKSSGLVREIGLKDALAMNLIIVAPATVYIFGATLLGTLPRVELVFPLIAAGFISLILGLVYSQLVAAMPRSGGDYVFMSRVVHPAVGALVGGAFLVAFFLSIGFGALFFAQVTFPFFLRAAGDALSIGALNEFVETISTQTGSFIVAMVSVLIAGAVSIAGARAATRTIFYGFLASLVAIALFVIYFLTTSHEAFVHAYNAASSPNAFNAVQKGAAAAGQPSTTAFSEYWLAIPLCILVYVGFTFAVYPGGEVKRAGSTVMRAIVGSLGLAILVVLAMWLALKNVAGFDFLRSSAYLSTSEPEVYEAISPVLPQGQEFWLLIASDPVSKLVCGIGFGVAALIQVIAYMFITSRLIFAMSFDRLLPTKLADVSRKTHSPVYAILVAVVLSIPFVYLGSYTTALTNIARNEILIFVLAFWLTSIGATILPFRRRDLYEASPKILGGSWGGIPVITVLGALSTFMLGAIIIITAVHDQISGGYTGISVTTLIVTFSLGPVVYVISRLHSRSTGIDLKLAMTELPRSRGCSGERARRSPTGTSSPPTSTAPTAASGSSWRRPGSTKPTR